MPRLSSGFDEPLFNRPGALSCNLCASAEADHAWLLFDSFASAADRDRGCRGRSIRVANQYERGVVFRLGKFNRTAGPGLYLVWPLVAWQIRLHLRVVTTDVEHQDG